MKKYRPFILLLTIIILITSSSLPIGALGDSYEILDYSDPDSWFSTVMDIEDFVEALTGENISDVEAEYLGSKFGDVFKYSDVIPDDKVQTIYFSGVLRVIAAEYQYETENGTVVRWIPSVARIDGRSVRLSRLGTGKYEGRFESYFLSDISDLIVEYTCSIEIDSVIADEYKNYAYNYAISLWTEKDEYHRRLEAYNAYQQYLEDLNAYNDLKQQWDDYNNKYQNWLQKQSAYNDYINITLPAYEKAYAEWQEYLAAKKQYDEIDWPVYQQYLNDKAQYDKDKDEYDQYLAKYNEAMATLDVIDSIYLQSEMYGRQLYGILMSDLVTGVMNSVEARYDELKEIAGMSISKEMIFETREITEKLRPLIKAYHDAKDPVEKFNCYKENYAEIKDYFKRLTVNLATMFSDDAIKFGILDNGKDDFFKYIQLVCQLYVVSTGLDDGEIRSDTWYINGETEDPPTNPPTYVKYYWNGEWHGFENNEPLKPILDDNLKPVDDGTKFRDPSDIDYLPVGMVKPTPPKAVDKPDSPKEVSEPIRPDVVQNPGSAPTAPSVELGNAPSVVPEATAPISKIYTEIQLALIEAIENGTIKKRTEGTNPVLKLKTIATVTLWPQAPATTPETMPNTTQGASTSTPMSTTGTSIESTPMIPTESTSPMQTESVPQETAPISPVESTPAQTSPIEPEPDAPSIPSQCLVDFFDYDGKTLLYRLVLNEGERIVYRGEMPERKNTNKVTYTFVGWKNKDGSLVEDLGVAMGSHEKFYAYYESISNTYNITWIVDGKATIESYQYGAIPEYPGDVVKEEDAQYRYEFKGWDRPVSTVKGDATYTAEFDTIIKQYTIEWHFGDNVYSEIYNYGEMPSFKGSESDFIDEEYIYSFSEWDKELVPVKEDSIYTAEFNKTAIVEDTNGSSIKIEIDQSTYMVSVPESVVRIDTLLDLASDNNKKIKLTFDAAKVELELNEVLVSDMIQSKCEYIHIYLNEEIARSSTSSETRYSVYFLDREGNEISLENGITIRFTANVKAETRAYAVNEDGTQSPVASLYDNGTLTIKLDESKTIVLKNEYKITIQEFEKGSMISDVSVATPGDTVTLTLWTEDDYSIDFIKIVGTESGREYSVEKQTLTFVMPDEAIEISAHLAQNEYTIKFVVDGVVVSENKYYKGETVVLPETPKKNEDGKEYLFAGWTPTVTPVNGDKTYTAKFTEVHISVDNYEGERGTFYLRINILVASAVIAVASAVLVIALKKKKRRTK